METYFKRIFYYSQWQRIFCLMGTIFFHQYFLSIDVIRRRPIFKKILFLLVETVFFSFFQTLIRMEAVFWSTEIVFFNKFFILASGKGFWQNINLLLLFGALFCCRTPFLKLNVGQFKKKKKKHFCSLKPFYWVFVDIPVSGSSFCGQQKRSFHQILCHCQCIPILSQFQTARFYSELFFCCWKALLKLGVNQFSSISLTVEEVFPTSVNGFSIESYLFQRVETNFLSLARFSEKQRKKWFPLARKSVVDQQE